MPPDRSREVSLHSQSRDGSGSETGLDRILLPGALASVGSGLVHPITSPLRAPISVPPKLNRYTAVLWLGRFVPGSPAVCTRTNTRIVAM